MSKVFIVIGSASGDFDCSYEWNVKGFTDKARAESLATALNEIASQYTEDNCSAVGPKVRDKVEQQLKLKDPNVSLGNYGASYKVEPLAVE